MAASQSCSIFWLVLLALLVAQMGFGAYGVVFTKFAKESNVNPLVFCMLRDVCCVPVLFLAAYVAEKKIQHPNKKELPLFIGLGISGIFLGQLLYILGVSYTSPDIASMFQPLAAVFTVIVAVVFKIEKFPQITTKTGAAKIFGILIATGGAIIMNFGKSSKKNGLQNNTSDAMSLFGYLALLLSTMCSAFYIVLQKKYIFSVPTSRWRDLPISVTAWAYFFGAVFSAITSLYYANQPDKFHVESAGVLYTLIYAVFVTSALCYMLVTWCNMQVSTTLVSAAATLQVFFCVIISYIVLGETASALEAVGGLMIVFALLSVVWSNYQGRNMVLDKEELILPYDEQAEEKLLRNTEESNEEREPKKI